MNNMMWLVQAGEGGVGRDENSRCNRCNQGPLVEPYIFDVLAMSWVASRGPPWTCREAALGALARGLGVGVNHGTKHAGISIARAMLILFSELHRVHEYFIYHSLRYTTPNKIH